MNNATEIIALRKQGLTIRAIQKKLGISSPSVVQWHLRGPKRKMQLFAESFLLNERFPVTGDRESALLCAGFNDYRKFVLRRIRELEESKEIKEL